MLNHLDVANWSPKTVREWLSGLCDDSGWLVPLEELEAKKLNGRKLSLMTPRDLDQIGATKVDMQERIIEAIETLRVYSGDISRTTLQTSILRLATQARSLHQQLVADRRIHEQNASAKITLMPEYKDQSNVEERRVCLDTLAQVSALVRTVRKISSILNCKPFSKHEIYRSMRSLLLALSLEITSTAQRDQFVEQPNDFIERKADSLATYCDRIVEKSEDLLMVEPFRLETVRIEKNPNSEFGLTIRSTEYNHIVDKITPLSAAERTKKINEGDEIVQYNRCIIGWSPKSVERLVKEAPNNNEIIVTIKRPPPSE